MARIVIDAGHGGANPGAVYNGRQEKDDNLALALAVGRILQEHGVDVVYTRTNDATQSPFEKAQISNTVNPDFLVSIHRNSSPEPNQYSGVETLIFDRSGKKVQLAENINQELADVGFKNLGIEERPGLVILRRSTSPAVLVEVGFINSDEDNALLDEKFNETAQAIADGILNTLNQSSQSSQNGQSSQSSQSSQNGQSSQSSQNSPSGQSSSSGQSSQSGQNSQSGQSGANPTYYRVQTGAFRNEKYAQDMLYRLKSQGYPAFIVKQGDLYKVQVGAFENLDNAIKMEAVLRRQGYPTYLVNE